MKSASAELSLDLLTVSALSSAERALDTLHAHSSSALDSAVAVKTVARTRGVEVLLSWSRSHSLRAARERLYPRMVKL